MLRRVFENLVNNALQAMKGTGELTLESNDCDYKEGPSVCIDVRDTGEGMSEEFLQHQLFRPFASTKTKGLGLGLYQCRSIIRAHGGELTVRSRIGEGTNFRVALPAETPSLEMPTDTDADFRPGPKSATGLDHGSSAAGQ
jgi:signal transduction histidine kinase